MSVAVACPICLETLARPVLATCCGQSFCDACLQAALRTADACPMCREPLLAGVHSATRNRALEELLARLPLAAEHEVLLQIDSEAEGGDGKHESADSGADAASSRRALTFSAAAARARRCLRCRRIRRCEGCSAVRLRQWRLWCRVHWSSLQCAFYVALFVVFVFFLRVQEEEFAEHQQRRS